MRGSASYGLLTSLLTQMSQVRQRRPPPWSWVRSLRSSAGRTLGRKTWVGALLFLGCYTLFLLGLEWTAPGYIEQVEPRRAVGAEIEELLFATAFGAYWAGVYEQFT